jgi:hypothetical protein
MESFDCGQGEHSTRPRNYRGKPLTAIIDEPTAITYSYSIRRMTGDWLDDTERRVHRSRSLFIGLE